MPDGGNNVQPAPRLYGLDDLNAVRGTAPPIPPRVESRLSLVGDDSLRAVASPAIPGHAAVPAKALVDARPPRLAGQGGFVAAALEEGPTWRLLPPPSTRMPPPLKPRTLSPAVATMIPLRPAPRPQSAFRPRPEAVADAERAAAPPPVAVAPQAALAAPPPAAIPPEPGALSLHRPSLSDLAEGDVPFEAPSGERLPPLRLPMMRLVAGLGLGGVIAAAVWIIGAGMVAAGI
ncbi:hypothetical protein CKO38_09900 [Rhodospirillum rubrum]|uniref:hypothetical protein n=1 Tax=Rhodospirillum rubrum TaxID=1085 RepID=UPI001A92B211|nr:hypothetical protein [Rhodospirillum rubrum]MBK1663645.1 hypothetical protein [Rhodospirillum rubrum]MBK1676973.1 hypothetical protein [Rhodospirillum rubrum]